MASPESDALYTLGRRIERLFLLGVLLIVLTFLQTYLVTANKQLSEDQSAATITALLDKLSRDEPRLTALFQAKPTPPPNPAVPKVAPRARPSTEEEREIIETRKHLGLPEMPPPTPPPKRIVSASTFTPSTAPTYREALNDIVADVEQATKSSPGELSKFRDATKSPQDLIAMLQQQKMTQESKPTAVWGIQTPRLLQLQYAGLDYKIPLEFLSNVLAIALAPLIAGWLGSLYMTRQRELLLIAELDDYRRAFPHILNFVPVRFRRYESLFHPIKKVRPRYEAALNRYGNAVLRTLVLFMFAIPLVCAYAYSLFVLWVTSAQQVTPFFIFAAVLTFVMALQALALIIQEWLALHGKEFVT